jgi:hypothetical protein
MLVLPAHVEAFTGSIRVPRPAITSRGNDEMPAAHGRLEWPSYSNAWGAQTKSRAAPLANHAYVPK